MLKNEYFFLLLRENKTSGKWYTSSISERGTFHTLAQPHQDWKMQRSVREATHPIALKK